MSTTSASTSRGKLGKKRTRVLDPLRLIRITDTFSGTLLFERIFEWPEHTNTSNLGSLVQSFFQFAREVDGGDVESVYFEEGAMGFLPSATPRGMGSSEHRAYPSPSSDSMKLIKTRNDDVTVVLFHECLGPEPDAAVQEIFAHFLNSAANEFTGEFSAVLSGMRVTFAELNDTMPHYHRKLYEIQSTFNSFAETIDRLRLNIIRPAIRPDSSLIKSHSLDEFADDPSPSNS